MNDDARCSSPCARVGEWRPSAVAANERRHPLGENRFRGRGAVQGEVGVGVDVDEARCHDQASDVDQVCRVRTSRVGWVVGRVEQRGDDTVGDGEIGPEGEPTRSIDHQAPADEQVGPAVRRSALGHSVRD
jgi:hypothetical protein